MSDFSLDPVSTSLLTEGVKFLFAQAGEMITRWRAKRSDEEGGGHDDPLEIDVPEGLFDGPLADPVVDDRRLAAHAARLREAWKQATPYGSGVEPVEPGDREALESVDALRKAMELVLGQHLTFVGERRPATGLLLEQDLGTLVDADVEGPSIETVEGDVNATLRQTTDDVHGGKLKGPSIGRVSTGRPRSDR